MPRFLSEAELSVQIPGYYSKLSDVTLHTNYKQNSACHNVENFAQFAQTFNSRKACNMLTQSNTKRVQPANIT